MPEYQYRRLSQPNSIRLLQLLPREENSTNLRCKLFEYHLRREENPFHPYEALSYVWGSENKPRSILVDDQSLNITDNLYVLLSRLQYHSCPRIIWVDAVCINQADNNEKSHQIPLMAEIYAKASRVIVWLGEAENDGDRALEAIRLAGFTKPLDAERCQQAIPKLLQRQWFQRVWVR
jgi:hypothetical protein